ncbi:MAG TPA: alpha/beta fold hydrolase [Longimicrobiales bacterium]|nr:alpha/beta fold hydrolase [Longimicrobiales bacterium]
MRLHTFVVSALLCGVAAACVSRRVTPGHLFQPRPCAEASAAAAWPATLKGYNLERWTLAAESDVRLEAVVLRHSTPRAVLLYYGGNSLRHCPGALEDDSLASAALDGYRRLGLSVVLLNYRGYGGSTGRPGFESTKRDALLLHDRIRADSALTGLPVIVHGQSMGTLFAGYVALNRPVAAAVLESPPTNIDEVVKAGVPWYAKLFVRVKADDQVRAQDNAGLAGGVTAPVLYVVGQRDRLTPPAMARRLYSISPSAEKRLVVVSDGRHGDLVLFSVFWEAVAALVDSATLVARPR